MGSACPSRAAPKGSAGPSKTVPLKDDSSPVRGSLTTVRVQGVLVDIEGFVHHFLKQALGATQADSFRQAEEGGEEFLMFVHGFLFYVCEVIGLLDWLEKTFIYMRKGFQFVFYPLLKTV